MIGAASKPIEAKVNIEWHYQVRLYGWEDRCTLRILKLDVGGWIFLTPHLAYNPATVADGFSIVYGPWHLYQCGSIIKLDHCGVKVGMRVYAAFWQAALRMSDMQDQVAA